jgi:hypothetical protein
MNCNQLIDLYLISITAKKRRIQAKSVNFHIGNT